MTRASMMTTLIALLLSAGSLLIYEFMSFRDAWVADLRGQADLIAHSTAAAIVFNDPKAARENLALLKQTPRVRAAAIFQANGLPFATFVADPAASVPARLDRQLLAAGSRFIGSTLETAYPIEQDGETIGNVYLQAEHDVWARAATYAAILVVVTAASLALAYIVFGRLQQVVTEPLTRMTRVAQEVMERRDWTLRAPSSTNRDIDVLVQAFNGMLAEVGSRTGELEREMVVRQQAEAELRLLDRKKDEFLATLAHELRNPLAPMTNAVALVRRPGADSAVRDKAISILDRQLRHMVRLIDDLLDVSRVATGKLSLHMENVDLIAILRAAVELAEPAAAARQLQLSSRWPAVACPMVGDSARLLQVFSNLLNNACRYTPPGGRIDVEAEAHEGSVEVTVRDTGVGIDPAMQHRIFDLFEQADKSLERGNAGLGIGLTLARQLVQLHGGEIEARSEGIGRGSRFVVRLPRAQASAAPVARATPAPAASAGAMRVVLADDNVDFAESLQTILEMHGHRVVVVNDGDAALAAVRHERPDVAVLDIGMPGLNGYEVARRLRADPMLAPTPLMLIAVTGWGQAADKRAAADAGFDQHLLKPLDPDDLLDLLAALPPRQPTGQGHADADRGARRGRAKALRKRARGRARSRPS
jgi:signal transduction histidine kinase/FixJ family two-component response regulator